MENRLERKYGLFTAICMVVGIVIGSGVFFKAQTILQKTEGNMPLGIVAWVIGGLIMIFCILAFAAMAQKYGEKIAVGVDARDGKVAVNGWKEITDKDSYELCEEMAAAGVKAIIYTDISKDGGLTGTNMAAYERLSKIEGLKITASGGISSEEELEQLAGMVDAAILGKAIYAGRLDLARCVEIGGPQE